MGTALLLILGGLAALTAGAELLVRGAASLALRLGVPPLAVGLTIVAMGTSSPELLVSVHAAWTGEPAIAVGNVVGSNIFNIAAILGLVAVLSPIACHTRIVRREVPIMIAVTALVLGLAVANVHRDVPLGRAQGALLLALIVLYTTVTFHAAKQESDEEAEPELPMIDIAVARRSMVVVDVVLLAVGIGLLTVGARFLVSGSVAVAELWGVSTLVIGLTIVSAGTSAPELATSLLAALRRQPDISVGNIVGSNIFNLLGILGAASVVQPVRLPAETVTRDLPIALGVSVLCLPIMFTHSRISRWEGLFLLAIYTGYLVLLLASA